MTFSLIVKIWSLLIRGLFPGATVTIGSLFACLNFSEDGCHGLGVSRVDILGPVYKSLVILVSDTPTCARIALYQSGGSVLEPPLPRVTTTMLSMCCGFV